MPHHSCCHVAGDKKGPLATPRTVPSLWVPGAGPLPTQGRRMHGKAPCLPTGQGGQAGGPGVQPQVCGLHRGLLPAQGRLQGRDPRDSERIPSGKQWGREGRAPGDSTSLDVSTAGHSWVQWQRKCWLPQQEMLGAEPAPPISPLQSSPHPTPTSGRHRLHPRSSGMHQHAHTTLTLTYTVHTHTGDPNYQRRKQG